LSAVDRVHRTHEIASWTPANAIVIPVRLRWLR
jgi:hypothetical protein